MTTVQTDRGSELSNDLQSKGNNNNKMHLESLDDPDTERNIVYENNHLLKESA